VLDTVAVDARRQLVIIRRDNIEHLLMIGGGSDLVIETNIVRGSPATAGRDNAGRMSGALEPPRTSPLYEGASWPAPQPEASVRLQRAYPIEEPTQWPAAVQPESRTDKLTVTEAIAAPPSARQEPVLRTQRSSQDSPAFPVPRDAPVQRNGGIRPASPSLRASSADRPTANQADTPGPSAARLEPPATPTQPAAPPVNVAARLASRLEAPQRQAPTESQSPDTASRAPVQPLARTAEDVDPGRPPTGESAETPAPPEARSKAAAGPRFSFPNLKFDRSAPTRSAPPQATSERPQRPSPAPATPERSQARPRSKTLYESLEQEMASLLGKPPGKS
jgi:hypothetical protein